MKAMKKKLDFLPIFHKYRISKIVRNNKMCPLLDWPL